MWLFPNISWQNKFILNASSPTLRIGLYHPLDGITNLKYKLLCFLTPNKKISKRKALAFNWDRCCHLELCLQLILFHYLKTFCIYKTFMIILKVGMHIKYKRWTYFKAEKISKNYNAIISSPFILNVPHFKNCRKIIVRSFVNTTLDFKNF